MLLRSDLVDLLDAVVNETLSEMDETKVDWDPRPSVCVVMCSGGYPGKYENGKPIAGLEEVSKMADVKVFHAGTKLDNGRVVTDGGRVLGVTALGETLAAAKKRAYEAVAKISFKGAHFRTDIADKALRG
jgi:phosphoribosylamine--glycine ligase